MCSLNTLRNRVFMHIMWSHNPKAKLKYEMMLNNNNLKRLVRKPISFEKHAFEITAHSF